MTEKEMKDLMSKVAEGEEDKFINWLKINGPGLDITKYLHNKSGDSILHDLAKLGAASVLEIMLSTCTSINVDIRNLDGKTGLHDACQQGHLTTVITLIAHGATVNTLKKADWSPAMLAVTHTGRIEILKVLVESGADLGLVNKDGWTVFQLAARTGDVDVLRYILTILPDAYNTVSGNGRTCLHTASLAGQTQVVQFLLDLGVDPNSGDSCENTAVMDAVRSSNVDCLDVLLRCARLNVRKRDKLGRSVVHVAAEAGQLEPISIFKQIDLSLEELTLSGQTPLHSAAREGQDCIVKFLLQNNVAVDTRDENGRSALFLAVSGQHLETAKLLLEAGARLLPDNDDTSITSLARKLTLRELIAKYE